MANPTHVEMLRSGVESWNTWRSSRPGEIPDFSGADLTSIDLSALHAPDASGDEVLADLDCPMVRADLRAANFSSACLNSARLTGADLDKANFGEAQLAGADLSLAYARGAIFDRTNLINAKIRHAMLYRTHLSGSDFSGADLTRTDLSHTEASATFYERAILRETFFARARLEGSVFNHADLTYANFVAADLSSAKLRYAVLHSTNLESARLVGADLSGATLSECMVHGIAAWDVILEGTVQSGLAITKYPEFEDGVVRVDDIQIAHFLYLLIENPQVRKVIDSVAAKVVLILGRFSASRKPALDALREKLKRLGYVPVLFDFEKPFSRDLTETVGTIAHLSRFVLVDLTDAKSVPQELSAIIPFLPSVPVQPIIMAGERAYAMFEHFQRYPWVLPEYVYTDTKELLRQLEVGILPAVDKFTADSRRR